MIIKMDVFNLAATLLLDSSAYIRGLTDAEGQSNSFMSNLTNGFKNIASISMSAFKAVGDAALSFSKSAIEAGKTFDSSMSQVAATMGYSVEELNDSSSEAAQNIQKLRDFAQEMGATTQFSASQAADALNYMALAGYDATTSMDMLPTVLNLAAAGGIDLADASDMVTDASSALGLNITETAQLVDKMAAAASKSNTSVDQLGRAILAVGGTAKTMSGGTTELATALGILADNGTKGAEGGTALRNILTAFSSDKFEKSFGALGVSAYDAEGNMRELVDVFADMNKAMEKMSDEEKTKIITKAFNKADLKNVNALLATSADRWYELGDAIDSSFVDVGTALQTSAVNWQKYLSEPIFQTTENMGEAWQVLGEDIQERLQEMGWTAEETADHISHEYGLSMEDARLAVAAVNEELQNGKSAAADMAAVQMDNLAGDLQLFDSALEGVQITLSDVLTPSLREFVQFGSDALSRITKAAKENGLQGVIDEIGNIISDGINMIGEYAPKIVSAATSVMTTVGKGIIENIPKVIDFLPVLLDNVISLLVSLGKVIIDNAPIILNSLLDLFKMGLSYIVDNASGFVLYVKDFLLTLADFFVTNLPTLIPLIVDAILQLITILTDPEVITQLYDAQMSIIMALADGIVNAIPIIVQTIPTIFMNIVKALWHNLPVLLKTIFEACVNILGSIYDNLFKPMDESVGKFNEEVFGAIGQFFSDIFGAIGQFFSETWDAVTSWFSEIWNGISSWFIEIWNGIVDFFNGIYEFFKPALDAINYLIETVCTAIYILISRALTAIYEEFVKIWTAIKDFFEPYLTAISDFIQNTWNNITSFFSGVFDTIFGTVESGLNKAGDFISEKLDFVKNLFVDIFTGIKDFIFNFIDNAVNWGKDLIDNFVAGIKSGVEKVGEGITLVADKIRAIIGFSEPSEGPLAVFHEFAPDMVDLFVQGLEESRNKIGLALSDTFGNLPTTTIKQTMQQTPAIAGAGVGGDFIFPIYLGDELIDTAVVSALDRVNYKSSGRA